MKYEVEKAQIIAAKGIGDDFRSNDEYRQILAKAQTLAQELTQFDPNTQSKYLQELKITNYALYMIVNQILKDSSANVAAQQVPQQVDQNGQPVAADPSQQGPQDQPDQANGQDAQGQEGLGSSQSNPGTEEAPAPAAP